MKLCLLVAVTLMCIFLNSCNCINNDNLPQESSEDSVQICVKPREWHTQQGIDVSRYQGDIDWEEVACDATIRYAYIKASHAGGWGNRSGKIGSLNDPCYKRNIREARKAGLLVGAYHFFNGNDIQAELTNIRLTIRPEDVDLVPMIDVEDTPNLNLSVVPGQLLEFMKAVEAHYGKRPILYTNVSFYNKYIAGTPLSEYPLMIASYRDAPPQLSDNKQYIIWQYTNKGSVPGIDVSNQGFNSNVDRSRTLNGRWIEELLLN